MDTMTATPAQTNTAPAPVATPTHTPQQNNPGNANPQAFSSQNERANQATTTQQTPGKPTAPQPGSGSPADTQLHEVRINGKVHKMTIEEMRDLASMSHFANSRFEEASKKEKRIESLMGRVKDENQMFEALADPALGLTEDQIRDRFEKWYLNRYVEPETLSPEQRRLKQAETELKKYKDQEQQSKAKQQQDAATAEVNKHRETMQAQIIEALETSGLPKDPKVVARIAFYMRQNLINGWEAPMDMIVRQVKKETQADGRSYAENSTPEQVIEWLGEATVNKLLKYHLEKIRSGRKQLAPPFTSNPSESQGMPDKISMDEVARNLRDMRSGKKLY